MKCPVCIQEGKKSTLRDTGGTCTLASCAPFYDEEGKHHYHDHNTTTLNYSCSNGHSYTVSKRGSCWCGWNANQVPVVRTTDGRTIVDPEVLEAMTDSPSPYAIFGSRLSNG